MTGFVCDLDHDALPFRYCATKGCTWTEPATPPLVAASLVPPVVPDSEATDCECGHEWERHGPEAGGCVECRCRKSSGSGVVPDKPALAPETLPEGWTYETSVCVVAPCCGFTFAADHTDVPNGGYSCPVCVVPAVTDDEAATVENALAARLHQVCRFPAHKGPQVYWDCFVLAREALTALRSAGFLIVYHSKET